jgi:hypothetical protein
MAEIKQMNKLDTILNQYQNSIRYYDKYRSDWARYYKKYRSIYDTDTTKEYFRWRSKLFIPATAAAVDGLVFNLALTLFGPNPFFDVAPREEGDVRRAQLMRELLMYEFEKSNFKMEFAGNFLKQLSIYGTSFGKVVQRKITKKTKKRKEIVAVGINGEIMPTGEYEVQEDEEVVYDGPVFETIDIFDVIISTKAKSLQDTWVIHRTEKTIGELKALEKMGIYSNVTDLENLILNTNDPDLQKSESRKYSTGLPVAWSDEPGDLRKVEILEYWDKKREKVTTIAGRSVIIRDTENPLGIDPFVSASLWQLPYEVYGIGVPEKCDDLQDQLNAEVNQRLDNRNLRQNLILKVRRGANVNVRNLISKPGAVWLTDDMTAIEPIQVPDIETSASFAEENILKQEIEEVTGITKYSKGAGVAGDRTTATEASIVARSGSKSFAYMVMLIEESALKPIIEKYYQLTEMFMDKEVILRVLGDKGYEFIALKPEDVRGCYDFIPQGTSELVDKNLKVQYLIQLLGIAKDDPALNRLAVYKNIWEALGQKNYSELFNLAMQPPMEANVGETGMNQSNIARQAIDQRMATGARMGTAQEGAMPVMMGGI